MRLYMVRRTRSFIQDNYAETDPANGRKFLTFEDGTRSYFPDASRRRSSSASTTGTRTTSTRGSTPPDVVAAINALNLPRYGLATTWLPRRTSRRRRPRRRQLQNLSRAGKRLMGFCRTNLFKRLESSGDAFLQSIERHMLRNYVFLHAHRE